jgi:hypothetical protein
MRLRPRKHIIIFDENCLRTAEHAPRRQKILHILPRLMRVLSVVALPRLSGLFEFFCTGCAIKTSTIRHVSPKSLALFPYPAHISDRLRGA